jgi:3-oxoacyl-[acyl-carrier-protein] synthase III
VGMNGTLTEFRDGTAEWPTLRQEGQTVFRWAVWDMAKVAKQALDAAGVTSADLAAFIPHQANMRIIDEFAKQLKLPDSVVIARDIATTGNTSAASIPLALAEAADDGRLQDGDLVLMSGFGAGMTWASALLRWGKP